MAKLKYTKPAFAIHQIPLVQGAGTGCFYNATSGENNCTVLDPDLGFTIFTEANNSCYYKGNPEDFCYTVPLADQNIYMS